MANLSPPPRSLVYCKHCVNGLCTKKCKPQHTRENRIPPLIINADGRNNIAIGQVIIHEE